MVNIIPFRGIRYNKQKIEDLNLVVTAPYDKINDQLQDEYYKRSPYNFVRLDKGREEDKYNVAKHLLNQWLEEKILIRDDEPNLYYYTQEYNFEGMKKIRKGFIALLELDEFENGNVLPHEHTLSGPKRDRFDLLEATDATFGQIFMLFSDSQDIIIKLFKQIEENTPNIRVYDDDKNVHCVWKVHDPLLIKKVQDEMHIKKVYIADGHHRYETSLNYRNIQREKLGEYTGKELFNYTMCTFINMNDENGISILPTHRFVKNLNDFNFESFLSKLEKEFTITPYNTLDELYNNLTDKQDQHVYGIIAPVGNQFYLLSLIDERLLSYHFPKGFSHDLMRLDVLILHKVILEDILGIDEEKLRQQTNVSYYRDRIQAFELLKKGEYQVGFLLNPTKMSEVKKVTENGQKMPQKSTDFYPKLLSGLVVNYLKE